ncbi:MAG: hypothetical protein HYU69_03175 [Bacteroidetes bacterium]|nr:hypothetical protein [Bacteroidota bacterium]
MGKNLSTEKSRLFNLILKSLAEFHSNITIEAILGEHIRRVEILVEKQLLSHALKLIKKAKNIAAEHGKYPYFLELTRWERRIINFDQQQADFDQKNKILFDETCLWIDKYKQFVELENLHNKMLGLQRVYGTVLKHENEKRILSRIKKQITEIDADQLDRAQKIFYYTSASVCFRYTGNPKKSLFFLVKFLSLYKTLPTDIMDMYNYISGLNNIIILLLEMRKFPEALMYLQKIKEAEASKLINKSGSLKILFLKSIIQELMIQLLTGKFDEGVRTFKFISEKYELNEAVLGTSFNFTVWYCCACIHFGAGEYRQSLIILNKIINHPEQEIRKDIQAFSRIVRLLVLFELQNELNLHYYIRSTAYYLLKRQRVFKLESYILDFLRKKLPKLKTTKEFKEAFITLRIELLSLNKKEKEVFEYFDIISWLESKIYNRPFAEIVRNKARQVTLDQGRE